MNKEELILELQDFFNNDIKKMSLPMIPIKDIENILESEFSFGKSELDTNGWQVDFWNYMYSEKNGKICISGSLYYGDFQISKEDKDKNEEDEN